MVFSTPFFLFCFLPLFLLVYYLVPRPARLGWILAASWAFYGFWRLDFLALLGGVSLLNWLAGLAIQQALIGQRRQRAQTLVAAAVTVNLAVLGYFKYANFGIEAFNALLTALGVPALPPGSIILPVGISFFVFHALSYIIDVYRGNVTATRSFTNLAAYLALFPQLVAGPIVRYKDLAAQLAEPHLSPGRAARGFRRFVQGLAKKVLIADSLAALVEGIFALDQPTMAEAWLGSAAYALQLYFDFSGYSDMAIGLALMLGFRFRENFRAPYRSASITEFWQRWHISLSTWLRDYLYIPLGGNRRGPGRTYGNLALVMVLGGLWHGAAWTFIAWGAWHGLWLILERRFAVLVPGPSASPWLRWGHQLRTVAVVLVGWTWFRASSWSEAVTLASAMLGRWGWEISAQVWWQLDGFTLAVLAVAVLVVLVEGRRPGASRRVGAGVFTVVLLVLSVIKLLADTHSPFLYFQF